MDRNTELIRTDQTGRLRFTRDQRQVLLDAFESSGQTASGFATQHGIKYTTFANWVQKRRADRSMVRTPQTAALAEPLLLAEVSCEAAFPPSGACAALEVRLSGGARLAISGMVQVPLAAALIRELSRSC